MTQQRLPLMEVFTKLSLINGGRILLCFSRQKSNALKKFEKEIEFSPKCAFEFKNYSF